MSAYIAETLKAHLANDLLDPKTEGRPCLERLCQEFRGQLPTGAVNPPIPDPAYAKRRQEMITSIEEGRQCFEELSELFNGVLPELVARAWVRYENNREHSLAMLRMKPEAQARLMPHEFFPFWPDFNAGVHRMFQEPTWDAELLEREFLDGLTFSSTPVGRGAFGAVYPATAKDGSRFALKVLHDFGLISCTLDEFADVSEKSQLIYTNILSQLDLWREKPFIPVRAQTGFNNGFPPFMYLMDFVEGDDVEKMIGKRSEAVAGDDMRFALLFTYAKMLERVHERGSVVVDNSWRHVLVNGREIRVCDPDFITPEHLLPEVSYVRDPYYYSKEQTLRTKPTKHGDLECFAHMIYTLFTGVHYTSTHLLYGSGNQHFARENKRHFAAEHREKLPAPLRDVVAPTLTYPRNDSITATDFVSAIKQTYKA
jgi:hypothetical protein